MGVADESFLATGFARTEKAWAETSLSGYEHHGHDPGAGGLADGGVDYCRSHLDAAQAIGFCGQRVIGVSQYWARRRALGSLPFWFFFVAMVWQLLRWSVIQGTDVILDGTTQRLWFHDDAEAGWSFPKPWKGSVWGYKVHTLLCRGSQLPILFLVTPANRQESIVAIPLLALAVTLFGLPITLVWADSGFFILAMMTFIRYTLNASFMIDYNILLYHEVHS